jgi:hypothetical protein
VLAKETTIAMWTALAQEEIGGPTEKNDEAGDIVL